MNTKSLEEISASNDQMIVKGKRSKRLRASSSTSSICDFNSNSFLSSPTSTSTSTDEDQDLANCLILLAQGGLAPQMDRAPPTNGKLAVYVYVCKTCNRSFSSFQALGGHRASHKKPKSAPPQREELEEAKFAIAPPPPTELIGDVENKPKIHECSICGSEFASGQALGGHMRRHRTSPAAVAAGDFSSHDDHQVVEKARRMLTLDLNLPAPEEDGCEAEFRAFSSKQQPRHVFSAAALVDCHY